MHEKYINLWQSHKTMRKWPYTKLYTPAALSGLCAFCVLHSVWRNYLTQPPQQWVCPYPVFPLAQRLFYSQLKRFVLSLSYPTAMRLCLTLETDCFTFRDPVLTRSTNPVSNEPVLSTFCTERNRFSTKNPSAEILSYSYQGSNSSL